MEFNFVTLRDTKYFFALYFRMGEPLVLDPANPYQNVAANCRWDEVARHARSAMQMPLLKDISCYSWQ